METQKKLNNKGYVLIYCPNHPYSKPKNGWLKEHTIIMENFLKRRLITGECIHHINFDKTDNRIENLMLFKSHQFHSKFHQKIKQFGLTKPILRQISERWKNL
jgi:hypothetical protein